jgi:hypothetical protein
MPKENLTEIIVVLDKSGSMNSIKQDAIGGFNSFLKTQKELPGEALFTLVLFDTEYDMVYNGTPISLVQELNDNTYVPGGCTALLDAIGRTIDTVHARLSALAETQRPGKVIFAILTDGEENSSKEYSRSVVFDKITHYKEQNNWEFIFLAANQDAITEGVSIGISPSHTLNFTADSVGINQAMGSINQAVTSFRAGNDVDLSEVGNF